VQSESIQYQQSTNYNSIVLSQKTLGVEEQFSLLQRTKRIVENNFERL